MLEAQIEIPGGRVGGGGNGETGNKFWVVLLESSSIGVLSEQLEGKRTV